MNNGYVWSVAILLVAVFAHSRFNTPATTRSSTTRAQFYFAEISYVVCSLLLLMLLSGLIVASPDVVKFVSGGKGPVARVQAELRRKILRDCELLRENICNFAAQGILQCAPTRCERDRAIREMGFVMPSRPAAGLSATKLVSYAATVFLILFTGISLLQMSLGDPNTGLSKAFVMSVMVACIYGAAICCAIAPKGLWDFADIHKLKIRPAIGYVVSGLLAFGAAAAIRSEA